MFTRVSARLSYANVVATLALFLALCGGSYAALKLPRNSVGPKQLKKNSVTSAKVKAGSLLTSDFKRSQRSRLRGPRGQAGATGAAGPVTGILPTKVTLRGVYNSDFVAAGADEINGGTIDFPLRLPAAPGSLCVYKEAETNTSQYAVCNFDCDPIPSAEASGALIYHHSTAAGRSFSWGAWAVTAP